MPELEPNNTSTTANALTSGSAMSGQLSSSSDVDWYKLTVAAPGVITVALDVPTNSSLGYFGLSFYDTTATLQNKYATGSDGTYRFAAAAAGTYYLAMNVPDSFYYSGGSYSLTATHAAGSVAGYEAEANNTSTTANALTSGSAMSGQLSSSSDVDWYKLTVAAPGVITVALDVPTNSSLGYFGLSFYDTTATLQNKYATGSDGTYRFAAAAAGTYYLAMNVPDSFYYSGGSYSLTATHAAGSVAGYEAEANNTSTTANALTSGSAMSGQLSSSSDVDWYKLTVAAPGVITVALDVPTNSSLGYFGLSFYDTTATLQNKYATGSDGTYRFAAAAAGTYYLAMNVPDSFYYSGGSYSLTTTHAAGSVAGYEAEANNTSTTANALTSGSAMSGQLSSSSDVDWYKLTVAAPGVITVALDVPTNSSLGYFGLSFYDTTATLQNKYATGSDGTYRFAAAAAGTYYLAMNVPDSFYYSGGSYSLTATHAAGSVAGYEAEANNTSTTANALTSGSAMSGQLSSSSDVDWYKLTVAAPGVITVALDVPTNSSLGYFGLSFYDTTATLQNKYATGSDGTYRFAAAAAGTYYLAMNVPDSFYYSGGSYSLTATHAAGSVAGYEAEANNTSTTANALTSGSAMSGQLSSSSDVDWYKLTVAAPGVITVALDVPTNSSLGYFGLSFYDTTATLQNKYATGSDGTYRFAAAAAGTYYLAMNVPDSFYYSGGSYSLTATHAAGSVAGYEAEANNTSTTANALTSGSAMSGQLSSSSDVDWYKLTVAAPGVITVALDVPTNSSFDYFGLSFYNTTGTLLSRYSTGTDKNFQFAASQSGTYYFRVDAPSYYYAGGSYSITATADASSSDLEYEPNDEDANAIASGRQIRGQLSNADDADWFVIANDTTGDLRVAFDAPTNSTVSDYFRVWVFDEEANLLVSRSTGLDISFTVGAGSKGNYYAAVTTDNDLYYSSAQYGLTITSVASTANRESEPNDSSTSANELGLTNSIQGQLSGETDEDHFAVLMSSPGILTLNFDGPTNSTLTNYFTVSVYSPSGALLSTRSTGSDASLEVKAATAGRYTTVVSAASLWALSGEDYRLTARAVFEDPIPSNAIKGTSLGERLTGTTQDDLIYGLGGDDLINGGAGSDTVVFRSAANSLTINTIGGLTAVRGGFDAGQHAFSVSRLWNVEKIKTSTDERLITAASVAPIFGTKIGERIVGTDTDDVIDGLGGSDFIDGGGGTDTFILFGAREKFDVQSLAGITRIEGLDGAQEYAGYVTRLVNVETLAFPQAQTRSLGADSTLKLFGSVGSERLVGTSSDEVIDGQGGADTIDGGAGDDTLVVFGRYQDFDLTLPSQLAPSLTLKGKPNAARDYAGQSITATNVEKLVFSGDVVIEVNNPPSLIVSPASTLLAEGEPGKSVAIRLSTQPTQAVQVQIQTDNQISATAVNLSFDQTNWSQPQSLTISAVDDDMLERQHTARLSLQTLSEDSRYQSQTFSISYTITDNESQNMGGVSGKFWNDEDGDGVIDSGEPALMGWTVFDDANRNGRLDTGEATAKTDTSGQYRLDELSPGKHTIVARSETGWAATFPSFQSGTAAVLKNTAGSEEVTIGGSFSDDSFISVLAAENYANLGVATNIGAFRNDSRFADIEGQGLSVVVVDSGIDLDHSFFGPDANNDGIADRIVFQYDFFGKNDGKANDFDGHGTHVAGIVGSSDVNYPGVAPKVNLVILKVFPDGDGSANSADIVEALNWVVANAGRYNVAAVNLSLGSGDFDTVSRKGFLSTQFAALANAGVIVVSASGNGYDDQLDGDPQTKGSDKLGVAYPSSDPYSLSVGAVWAYSGGNYGSRQTNAPVDAIAVFSQRDDTESDIFAPGAFITSARNGGGTVAYPGTSMAAPQIAGMVALAQQLASRELGRRLSFEEIRDLFKSTGKPIIDGDDENDAVTNTGLTFYRADMLALGEAILAMRPQVSHTVDITAKQTVADKNFGFTASSSVQTSSADDFIVGAVTGEIIRGSGGDDIIRGEGGDDEIYGEAGNDTLEGGIGDDLIDGGAGTDQAVFSVSRSSATILFDAARNEYSVTSTADGSDRVKGVETFVFATQTIAAANLLSRDGNDTIVAGAGDDTLDGGAGNDLLYGGAGNDTYFTDSQSDLMFENFGEGTDTVVSSASFYLYAHLENLTLTDSAAFGVGNELDNVLTGNDRENLLIGWDGSDTLSGGAARDALFGVDGNDVLRGDAGVDYIVAGLGNDTVYGGDDADEIYGQEGDDLLYGGDDFATDILVGGEGNDTIHGGPAWDLMYGGAGNDTFYVSQQVDWVFEQPGEGTDAVIADSPNGYYLYANVENLTLVGNTPFGVGNELANLIVGNAVSNVLLGGAGNDTLDGGQGLDILWGQDGADTFRITSGTGLDIIADFQLGADRLDVSAYGFTSLAQLKGQMVQVGTDIALNLDNGDQVILIGVNAASLGAADVVLRVGG